MQRNLSRMLIGILAATFIIFLAAPASFAEDEILIGGALSLTGVQAPLDEPGLKGAQVAVKYLNEHGGILGKKVKFVNIDGKSDPVTVGNAAVELIDQGAKLMVAPCDFDFGGKPKKSVSSEFPPVPRIRCIAPGLLVTRSLPYPCGTPRWEPPAQNMRLKSAAGKLPMSLPISLLPIPKV